MAVVNSDRYNSRIGTQLCDHGRETTIKIQGAFDFELVAAFRDAYEGQEQTSRYHLDLTGCSTVTSAGLGMMLRMYDYLGKDRQRIRVSGINEYIVKVFSIAKFERFFNLELPTK